MIRFKQVTKRYRGAAEPAVRDVHLHVRAGELVVLLGESGCGKTTTLKMVNRLIEPTDGAIEVDGRDVSSVDAVQLRRSIGYVFQGIGLFGHMTVGQNIAVVPGLLRWRDADVSQRVDELLAMVGLPPREYRDRRPRQLSGGQQQRVGVARALAARPRIMLMDEPFGALDPLTRDDLQQEYVRLHRQLALTSIMVTHDMTEALLMADRIAVMLGGRIVSQGTPHALLCDPGHEYTQRLMAMPRRQADRVEALVRQAGAS